MSEAIIRSVARALWKQERDSRQHDEPYRFSWYEAAARTAYEAIHREMLARPSLNGRPTAPTSDA